MKHNTHFISVFNALFLALTLGVGCDKKTPPSEVEPPKPTPSPFPTPYEVPNPPTPTPKPTPRLDADADRVRRNVMLNVGFTYRVILNGSPLTLKNGYEVDALEVMRSDGRTRVLVPLRAVGEKLGYKVDWQPRKRRVSWSQIVVPPKITLVDGWSYLNYSQFQKWMRARDKNSKVESQRFDRVTGYIEIWAKEASAKKAGVR